MDRRGHARYDCCRIFYSSLVIFSHNPAFNREFDAEFLVIRCDQNTIWRAQRAEIIRTKLMPLRGSLPINSAFN